MENITPIKNSGHSRKAFTFSIGLLICATVFFMLSTFIFLRDADRDAKYLELSGDMRVLLHQISTSSREATDGKPSAFVALKKASDRFDQTYQTLLTGDGELPGVGVMMSNELQELGGVWAPVKTNAETIVANRDRILFLHDVVNTKGK